MRRISWFEAKFVEHWMARSKRINDRLADIDAKVRSIRDGERPSK